MSKGEFENRLPGTLAMKEQEYEIGPAVASGGVKMDQLYSSPWLTQAESIETMNSGTAKSEPWWMSPTKEFTLCESPIAPNCDSAIDHEALDFHCKAMDAWLRIVSELCKVTGLDTRPWEGVVADLKDVGMVTYRDGIWRKHDPENFTNPILNIEPSAALEILGPRESEADRIARITKSLCV